MRFGIRIKIAKYGALTARQWPREVTCELQNMASCSQPSTASSLAASRSPTSWTAKWSAKGCVRASESDVRSRRQTSFVHRWGARWNGGKPATFPWISQIKKMVRFITIETRPTRKILYVLAAAALTASSTIAFRQAPDAVRPRGALARERARCRRDRGLRRNLAAAFRG
jgi:hypothetical protein